MHQIQPDSSCSSALVGAKYLRRHADLILHILRTPIACPIRTRSVCRYNMGVSENSVPLKPMVDDHYPY